MQIHDLETPSILIDMDVMERNIQRMQAHCDSLGLKFRPHIKTHKIPEIARMQLEAGAVGIACQKVSEAEVFAQAGFNEIQIPYNIVGPQKTRRLVDLALYNRVTISADHPAVAKGLSEAAEAEEISLRVLIDIATHIKRTGARPEEAIELAKKIDADDHLHFAGILIYPSDPEDRPALLEVIEGLNKAGIGVDVVSGGGFGAARFAAQMPELTELRVGTYVFNDWGSVTKGWSSLEDCAMKVMATVVSHPTDDRVILDCGSKTLTTDFVDGGISPFEGHVPKGYGLIVEYPRAHIYKLSEEHAHIDMSACETRPEIGERVHVIPVHTCVVTNLHNQIYGIRGEVVEKVWPVAARGLVW